jgi:adenine deaminase
MISHDCYYIFAIGTTEELISEVLKSDIDTKGGICFCDTNKIVFLNCAIAGLM